MAAGIDASSIRVAFADIEAFLRETESVPGVDQAERARASDGLSRIKAYRQKLEERIYDLEQSLRVALESDPTPPPPPRRGNGGVQPS